MKRTIKIHEIDENMHLFLYVLNTKGEQYVVDTLIEWMNEQPTETTTYFERRCIESNKRVVSRFMELNKDNSELIEYMNKNIK